MQTRLNSVQVCTSLCLVGVLCLLAGCMGDSKLAAVSGTIKYKGEVVPQGEVVFYPVGGGRPSIGSIDENGRYELTSKKKGDGVAPGAYKVSITAFKTISRSKAGPAPQSVEEETEAFVNTKDRLVWIVPQEFSESRTTPLTAEVKKGIANEINFDPADF